MCEDRGCSIVGKGYVLTNDQLHGGLPSNREASCIGPHFYRGLHEGSVNVQKNCGQRVDRGIEEHSMGLDLEHV